MASAPWMPCACADAAAAARAAKVARAIRVRAKNVRIIARIGSAFAPSGRSATRTETHADDSRARRKREQEPGSQGEERRIHHQDTKARRRRVAPPERREESSTLRSRASSRATLRLLGVLVS